MQGRDSEVLPIASFGTSQDGRRTDVLLLVLCLTSLIFLVLPEIKYWMDPVLACSVVTGTCALTGLAVWARSNKTPSFVRQLLGACSLVGFFLGLMVLSLHVDTAAGDSEECSQGQRAIIRTVLDVGRESGITGTGDLRELVREEARRGYGHRLEFLRPSQRRTSLISGSPCINVIVKDGVYCLEHGRLLTTEFQERICKRSVGILPVGWGVNLGK